MAAAGGATSGLGALTLFVDQLKLEHLKNGSLAEPDKMVEFGEVLTQSAQGKVGEVSGIVNSVANITGGVFKETGSVVRGLTDAYRLNRISKLQVQCLMIQLAETAFNKQQELMDKVVGVLKMNIELHQRILNEISEMKKKLDSDVETISKQILQYTIRRGEDEAMTEALQDPETRKLLTEELKERRVFLVRGYEVTHTTLTALATSAKVDPEIVIRFTEQSVQIINKICESVQVLGVEDEKTLLTLSENALKSIQATAKASSGSLEGKEVKALPAPVTSS